MADTGALSGRRRTRESKGQQKGQTKAALLALSCDREIRERARAFSRSLKSVLVAAHDEERHLREVGDDKQHKDHEANHGHDSLGDAGQARAGNAAGHKEVHAHGRREEADGQVHDDDDAEVQGRDTNASDHGQQDGGQDDDGCQGFHEGAHDEQQDVDDEQDEELAVGEWCRARPQWS